MPASIARIPTEVIEEIIKYLPLDDSLVSVGLASKFKLAPLVFQDLSLARRHLDQRLQRTTLEDIFHGKTSTAMIGEWLPYNYRVHLFGTLIATKGLRHSNPALYNHSNKLPPNESLRVFDALLQLARSFDLRHVEFGLITAAASRNVSEETFQLLLNDPRIDPSENDNYAILHASGQGYVGIVRTLLAD
ncbi:UNVERIFIED_CONTAM: hypothetical protein HDU68_011750, partial [Siphonaria sp. JEL0065]